MSRYMKVARHSTSVPKNATIILALVFVFGLFTIGFDQGHLFSIVQGAEAFDSMYLHELSHDLRHAAGFPCH
ncbi:MAG: Cobalt transporter subunit (CbtB) [Cenarchaeum symbiont of Oopsacas minuta]|nr:Cobalt transporter subunit (CbtB) [Cenarchaeum symbiont of Oopsacas minuta]